jgi:hypothetical protein
MKNFKQKLNQKSNWDQNLEDFQDLETLESLANSVEDQTDSCF